MADVISAPLEFLFNLLFFQAVVPRSWRHAYVIPIRKKPPHCDPNNYRPVSITSVFCRLSEKILKKVIVRHITCNQVLSDHQSWVQSKKSTVTLMLEAMNNWTSVLDTKKIVKWIEEFLADRTFQVLVNGHASTVRHAISGVPQGSVLSPILFNIYTFDLAAFYPKSNRRDTKFADSSKIYSI
ncbi:hypothetical protein COOONC_01794, partial [Cooperia oncophora]